MRAMRIMEMTPQTVAATIEPVLERHPVERAWLFGSVVRGDQHRGSDIDLIVELDGRAPGP